jgi:hypothetical protein
MANDRIWMTCGECKAKKLLYKYYPQIEFEPGEITGGYIWDDAGDWMNEHLKDCFGNPSVIPDGSISFEKESAGKL